MRPIWLIDRALHAPTWGPIVRMTVLTVVVCCAVILMCQSVGVVSAWLSAARLERDAR
ncbi:hypothetical protein [Kibdelosporangium aridum]|uniref:hypothetical protein n=1 Tax=Kibdelosporangium aridum TaxID=2030 RepID=UPI000A74FDE0|nr:hypothetical protein [Kibdelosporangium aridum]